MRTTVEITNEQRVALTALAARRGLRGFSALVREAIDQYLAAEQGDDLEDVLALRGLLDEDEAEDLERHVTALREAGWRTF
jgi:hypothetical protein